MLQEGAVSTQGALIIVSVPDIQVCEQELHFWIQNRAGMRRLTVTLNRKWWASSLNYWDSLEL